MPYNKTKYQALRSLDVPRPIALALADNSSPLNVTIPKGAAVPNLAGDADLPTTVAKVNALLTSLRAAGLIA